MDCVNNFTIYIVTGEKEQNVLQCYYRFRILHFAHLTVNGLLGRPWHIALPWYIFFMVPFVVVWPLCNILNAAVTWHSVI